MNIWYLLILQIHKMYVGHGLLISPDSGIQVLLYCHVD